MRVEDSYTFNPLFIVSDPVNLLSFSYALLPRLT